MDKKMEMKAPVAVGCGVILIALGVAAGVMFFAPEHRCPEDYWPHKTPAPIPNLLEDILVKAVAAHDVEVDPIKKGQIHNCILLTLKCAWQDLSAHNPTQQSHHIQAVQTAAAAANVADWAKVEKFMTEAYPIPGEPIEHPH
jgi:hypothetical protein